MYLERAEQFNNLRLYAQIGKREPVNCTALGKVLLSSLPEQDCERFVRQMEFRRLTANSGMASPPTAANTPRAAAAWPSPSMIIPAPSSPP